MAFNEAELKAFEFTAQHPRGRQLMAQAVKTALPDFQLPPDLQAREDFKTLLDERLKPLEEENKSLRETLAAQKSDAEWKAQLNAVKSELGWSEKRLTDFLKDFGERYKESAPVSLVTLAKAYEHENAPLTPSQSNVGKLWEPMSDSEKEWRAAVRDPNSDFMKAVRQNNQRKKKAIKDGWWQKAGQEWQELNRQRP